MIWWKIGGVMAFIVVLIGAVKYVENIGIERCEAKANEEKLSLALAYAERIKKAQEERDENQNIIDRLVAESRRVRVHIPVCGNNAGAKDQGGRERLLSDRVDESFARLQQRTTELFKRCDELNLDAIKVNDANH